MALFLLKPILWNTNKYLRPSGAKTSKKSFPGTNGFGHEEWNNSPRMVFKDGGLSYRAFHTEEAGNAPVAEHAGQTFVFMTVTHDGIQQLVGVAGNAKFQGQKEERARVAAKLDINSFADDAWALPKVRSLGAAQFKKVWNTDLAWIPNWVCPAEYYLWFDEPVTLDPQKLIGKGALPKMFSGYMAVERHVAAMAMNMVPDAQRSATWTRLMDAMRSAPEEFVAPPEHDVGPRATTRLAEYQARVGQGVFRERVLERWEHACAVTGLGCPELIKASHVKPWKASTSSERLDGDNGLMLAAHLDAFFDRGLITFDNQGAMLLSKQLPEEERAHFGLPQSLRKLPGAKLAAYLEYHRARLFRDNVSSRPRAPTKR